MSSEPETANLPPKPAPGPLPFRQAAWPCRRERRCGRYSGRDLPSDAPAFTKLAQDVTVMGRMRVLPSFSVSPPTWISLHPPTCWGPFPTPRPKLICPLACLQVPPDEKSQGWDRPQREGFCLVQGHIGWSWQQKPHIQPLQAVCRPQACPLGLKAPQSLKCPHLGKGAIPHRVK